MNDLLVKRALPNAAALVEAVADEDQDAVAQILVGLPRTDLYALAVVLAGQLLPETDAQQRMAQAVRMAASMFHTTTSEVLSTSRSVEALDARAVAAYAGKLLGLPSTQIGKEIGRDHSTVLHACGRVGETPRLRAAAQRIAEQLGWDRGEVA